MCLINNTYLSNEFNYYFIDTSFPAESKTPGPYICLIKYFKTELGKLV